VRRLDLLHFFMGRLSTARFSRDLIFISCVCGLLTTSLGGQAPQKAPSADALSSAQRGISLAAKGGCQEALPFLKKSAPHLADKQLKYRAVMATARCGMSLDQTESAVEALLVLNREFPHDPDVLYSTTHFYSELASRAAQELAATAPTSHQAEQLEAEAFESQENWDRAIAQYKKILDQEPKVEGIHYRLGRIFLSKSPADAEGAKTEFHEELKIDPENASAEFMLGEIARQAGQWDEAIGHFSRAAKFDEGFQEAYLALGMSLNSAGKFSDAIMPLRSYVKLQPADPAGHYQLATAYARTGQKADADREMALQREAAAKSPRDSQTAK
jgi:tetratricopeptide (TPR) repeat protein